MTRTLAVVPNWVGDTVMALPVLEALAGSDREVSVLAKPHLRPLLELAAGVAGVIDKADDDGETVARLRAGGFDEAVVLPNSFRSAWLPRRAGIERRYGYRGGWRSLLLNPAVPGPRRRRDRGRHQVLDYRELLEALGVTPPADPSPRLELPEAVRESARGVIGRASVPATGGPLVGLFPGAEFGPSKRWPLKRFAELTHALRRRRRDVRLVLLCGPGEVWIGVRIHEQSGHLVPVLGADLDLAGLAGLLSRLDLLITNDSGPMHLAAALGVPCVALFGPTDPARTRPWGEGHRVLYTDRWCSPCFRRRCPLIHHRCLKDIGVEAVVEAAEATLDRGPR